MNSETAASEQRASTLDNLQAAFNGESNARARYLAFAVKADEEGYGPVASLFRAAARAEQIHAANHAEVIRALGAEPCAVIEEPEVKTTALNLEAAIAGETYERDVMYPAFFEQARQERQKQAMRTFLLALKAEGEHARLYTRDLELLETLRGGSVDYYVCPVCGYTSDAPEGDRCPFCAASKEEYEIVR